MKCKKNQILNPATLRCVSTKGPIGTALLASEKAHPTCPPGQVWDSQKCTSDPAIVRAVAASKRNAGSDRAVSRMVASSAISKAIAKNSQRNSKHCGSILEIEQQRVRALEGQRDALIKQLSRFQQDATQQLLGWS
jgi:hypothetical protein